MVGVNNSVPMFVEAAHNKEKVQPFVIERFLQKKKAFGTRKYTPIVALLIFIYIQSILGAEGAERRR